MFGEKGFTPFEQRSARPTLEINGLTSGYQGEGSKTIVPAWARAKITFRLVPNQNPAKIVQSGSAASEETLPAHRADGSSRRSWRRALSGFADQPQAQAALRALKVAFGREPILIREGGSIPIVNDFKKILGADTLLLGLALPDDNAHSPNEKFDLDCFAKGQLMARICGRN